MAHITADRVQETSTTTGTSSYALAGAVSGFRAFGDVCADTDTAYYAAVEAGGSWEVGLGTWATGGTLARTSILASSNANAAVNWSAGTRRIFIAYPAGLSVSTLQAQTLENKTLKNPAFDGSYTEDVFTISDGGSVDIDPANGTIQVWTLGANRSPTASNFAAGHSVTLMIADGSAYAITWPSVTWVGGNAPTLATAGYTVIELWKVGSTLYGALVGGVA